MITYSSTSERIDWRTRFTPIDWDKVDKQKCLHDSCSSCGGTGIRKDGLGMCIHMISCPCPKCTPRY